MHGEYSYKMIQHQEKPRLSQEEQLYTSRSEEDAGYPY